jgi:hypothetical protein
VLAAWTCQVTDDSFRLHYWLIFLFASASASKPLQLFDVLVPSSLHMSIVSEQKGSPLGENKKLMRRLEMLQ